MFMSQSYRNILAGVWFKGPLYLGLAVISLTCTALSFYWAKDLLSCIGYYCVSGSTDDETDATVGDNVLGSIYFFVCVFITIGFLCMSIGVYSSGESSVATHDGAAFVEETERETAPLLKKGQNAATSKDVQSKRVNLTGQLSDGTQSVLVALTLLVLLPFLVVSCMLLPTWWNLMSLEGIQYYQALVPDESLGTYWSVTVGTVVFKLFPVSIEHC
jgi:hypothetical protein